MPEFDAVALFAGPGGSCLGAHANGIRPRPRWVALEQVPPVLVIWEVVARHLRDVGYFVWTGVLSAETFGVPQTRRRAFLIASLDGPVQPPAATHQTYRPGEPAQETPETLMGPGLKPWVSMADALAMVNPQWTTASDRPQEPTPTATATTVQPRSDGATGRPEGCSPPPRLAFRLARGAGVTERHGDRPDTPEDRPAPVITSQARSASWVYVNGTMDHAARRADNEPAPTVMFGHASNLVQWQPTHYDRRQGSTRPDGTRDMVRPVPTSEPAPTVAAQDLAKGRDVWTTVAGDPRVAEAGHHNRQMNNAVRVTVQEAAILQSFPPDAAEGRGVMRSRHAYYCPDPIRHGGRCARLSWDLGLSYSRCAWIARRRWLP